MRIKGWFFFLSTTVRLDIFLLLTVRSSQGTARAPAIENPRPTECETEAQAATDGDATVRGVDPPARGGWDRGHDTRPAALATATHDPTSGSDIHSTYTR
jgi:hypothetical protein